MSLAQHVVEDIVCLLPVVDTGRIIAPSACCKHEGCSDILVTVRCGIAILDTAVSIQLPCEVALVCSRLVHTVVLGEAPQFVKLRLHIQLYADHHAV